MGKDMSIADEMKELYNALRLFIHTKLNDPSPDPVRCTYQVVKIRGKQYAYRSQYSPKHMRTRNQYLGAVTVSEEEYKKFKAAEKRFKKLLRAHRHIASILATLSDTSHQTHAPRP